MSIRDVEDITAIIRQRAGLPKLGTAKERQPIPGASGVSTKKEISPSSTGGIASPLTETARTVTLYSDGTHDYRVAVQSTFTDADALEVVINWLDPDSLEITEI